MNIFNNKKVYIFLAIVLFTLTAFSFYYFSYVNDKKTQMQMLNYKDEAASMQALVAQKIFEKQKATTAIGVVLAEDKHLLSTIKNKNIDDQYYKNLVEQLRQETEYKNIWINIIDKDLNIIYRSWTDKKGDSVKRVRPDLREVLQTKKVTHTISSGKFTVAIKALIPIIQDGKVVAILEIISHFNSIAQSLEKSAIDSVVLLNKKHSEKLQHPFSENFLDGYYVANLDAPKDKLDYLKKYGVERYFDKNYKSENGYLIVSYPLTSFDDEVLGYYIMFKEIKDIFSIDDDFLIFKWIAIGFIAILISAGVVNLILFYILAKQKNYIKNIIDSSTNIVIINDKTHILDVNRTFFKYFVKEKNLEEFKEKYQCICDLFVNDEGYIHKEMDGKSWVDYILENPYQTNKVKLKYNDKVYYFNVGISLVSEENGYYSAIFADVTKEEMYKIELEKLSSTDPLTGIYNRRHFINKLEEKLTLAKRYKFPLSLIMIDIDHFKKVNDIHGHGVGDSVLIEYTKLISDITRAGDIFCRMGGEEFIIIAPYTDIKNAHILAEKIRKRVEEHKKVLPITMSFGVTEYIVGEDSDHILNRVDEALYEAKENGRNQVIAK